MPSDAAIHPPGTLSNSRFLSSMNVRPSPVTPTNACCLLAIPFLRLSSPATSIQKKRVLPFYRNEHERMAFILYEGKNPLFMGKFRDHTMSAFNTILNSKGERMSDGFFVPAKLNEKRRSQSGKDADRRRRLI